MICMLTKNQRYNLRFEADFMFLGKNLAGKVNSKIPDGFLPRQTQLDLLSADLIFMSKKGPRAECKDARYSNSWFSILMDSVSTLDKDGFPESRPGNK